MTKCMKMNIKCLEVLDFYKKIFIKLENIYINTDMVLKANNLSCYIKKLNRIFKKFVYDDVKYDYTHQRLENYDSCFVKLIVSQKTKEEMYNKLIEKFYNDINVHELVIVEDHTDIKSSVRDDILEQGEDTLTFLRNYIDQVDTDLDKHKLKEFAKELYVEASE